MCSVSGTINQVVSSDKPNAVKFTDWQQLFALGKVVASVTSGVWVATINSPPTLLLKLELLALSTERTEAVSPKLCFSSLLPDFSSFFF